MDISNPEVELAGIDRVDAAVSELDLYALRHTVASHLARSGASIARAQKVPEQ